MGTEEKFLVSLTQFGIAQQEDASILVRERARLTQETHIDLFQQAIPLFPVTDFAGSYEILPCALPTTRTWDNVVKRQITGTLATILAGFIIA